MKELSKKIGLQASFMQGGSKLALWKLERRIPKTMNTAAGIVGVDAFEVHPTAGGTGPSWLSTQEEAVKRAAKFPGWTLVRG